MRRSALIRLIRRESRARGLDFRLVRQGGRHEIWGCGGVLVPIPRHREIDDGTVVDGVFRRLEPVFGEEWWR